MLQKRACPHHSTSYHPIIQANRHHQAPWAEPASSFNRATPFAASLPLLHAPHHHCHHHGRALLGRLGEEKKENEGRAWKKGHLLLCLGGEKLFGRKGAEAGLGRQEAGREEEAGWLILPSVSVLLLYYSILMSVHFSIFFSSIVLCVCISCLPTCHRLIYNYLILSCPHVI